LPDYAILHGHQASYIYGYRHHSPANLRFLESVSAYQERYNHCKI
jgi:hypothetical protein